MCNLKQFLPILCPVVFVMKTLVHILNQMAFLIVLSLFCILCCDQKVLICQNELEKLQGCLCFVVFDTLFFLKQTPWFFLSSDQVKVTGKVLKESPMDHICHVYAIICSIFTTVNPLNVLLLENLLVLFCIVTQQILYCHLKLLVLVGNHLLDSYLVGYFTCYLVHMGRPPQLSVK